MPPHESPSPEVSEAAIMEQQQQDTTTVVVLETKPDISKVNDKEDEIPDVDEESVTSSIQTDYVVLTDSNEEPTEEPTEADLAEAMRNVKAAAIKAAMDSGELPEGTVPVIVEAKQESKLQAQLRKAGVAVAGGVMVGVGLVMIPLPTPCGVVVAASGMGVLATEFPEAQRIMDTTKERAFNARDKLVASIERSAQEQAAEEEMEKLNQQKNEKDETTKEESPVFMNAKERDRQIKLQSQQQTEYQVRRSVNRTNISKPIVPEEAFDAARRTFRKTASQLGQSVLPFLKSLDRTKKEQEVRVANKEEDAFPPLNQTFVRAPMQFGASPVKEKEEPTVKEAQIETI